MTNRPKPDTRKAAGALLLLLADWEEQIAGPEESLDYVRLTDKTTAFIEAVVELAVKRVRADMREPSRIHVAPFNLIDNRGEKINDQPSEATAEAAEPEAAPVDADAQAEHAASSALTYDEAAAGLGHVE